MEMKRRIASVIMALVMVCNIIHISGITVYAANGLNASYMYGVWSGVYTGYKNSTTIDRNIRLDIDECNAEGQISGFATIDSGDNGKYFFTGNVDFETGEITFAGNEWLYNPKNFGFASFSGKIDVNSSRIEGNVDDEDGRTFSITKVSSDYNSYRINISSLINDYTGEYDGNHNSKVVRRNIEIHINNIDEGEITGTAIISPSSKADASYGANGSYYFDGTINERTGKISLQGYEWIDYPVQYENFTFIELSGYMDVKNGVIIGTTENGIWAMETIDYSSVTNDTGFTLGVDNNNFVHTSSSTWEGAGFKGMKNYSIDDEYFKRLTANSSKSEKNRIKKEMNEDWGGSCYGIAMSMGLLYEKYITLADLTDKNVSNYHSMDYPCDDDKLRNMINYYQLSQGLENGGKSTSAVSAAYNNSLFKRLKNWFCGDDSLSVFLKYLVNYASQDHVELMGFSTSDGGHAVLVVGCEYDDDKAQYVVKIYDENSVDSASSKGKFSYMRIEKDFSSFVYTDSNGDKITNSSYRTIYFLDWDSLGNIVPSAPAQSSNHAKINFLLENDFNIVNDDGKYLEYYGTEFTGDMNIYDIDTIEADDGTHIIMETDDFSSVKITDIKNKLEMDVYNDNDYQSLSASNIDAAEMTLGEGIKIEGQNYSFKAYMSTDDISDDENGLISVAADAISDVSLDRKGDVIQVTSSDEMTNVVSENLEGSNVTAINQENSNELTITTGHASDVKVSNITLSSEKSTITVGETTSVKAEITPNDATNKNIVWSSSNETIAIINQNGKVTGVGPGSVIIYARATDESGVVGSYTITVVGKENSISIETNNISMGASNNLKKVLFKNTNKTLKYKTLKKKKQSYSVIKSNGFGKVTVSYMSKNKISKKICKKYIVVSKKGKVTVKKGAKKGTYKIKITVAPNNKFKKSSNIVYIKVK